MKTGLVLLLGLVAALSAASPAWAQEPFPMPPPPPPKPPVDRDAPPEPPYELDFGTDVSVGYLVGSLLGAWPEPGVHGFVTARYDAFLVSRDRPGWRIGFSLWGGTALYPLQSASDEVGTGDVQEAASGTTATAVELRFAQAGVMSILRPDPEAPIGPLFGMGFSRLDVLGDYYGGPLAIPALTFESGARQGIGDRAFLDWTVRAHWSSFRSALGPTIQEEWWLVQAGVQLGLRAR